MLHLQPSITRVLEQMYMILKRQSSLASLICLNTLSPNKPRERFASLPIKLNLITSLRPPTAPRTCSGAFAIPFANLMKFPGTNAINSGVIIERGKPTLWLPSLVH